ncbi:hypothetical protein AWB82_05857 [Caballeronia glebae]|uniref:Uncharacterized protein n=1 Tax=Caballeronia glebae TaxID=1777143 RepID=A0A158CUY1_9BURK|nr:hypothetical protein AWB82_05857 [Caballeronia glebae]
MPFAPASVASLSKSVVLASEPSTPRNGSESRYAGNAGRPFIARNIAMTATGVAVVSPPPLPSMKCVWFIGTLNGALESFAFSAASAAWSVVEPLFATPKSMRLVSAPML